MRAAVVAAERARHVRDAARAWRRAGLIGEEALRTIVARYPDDRRRFGPGFRALAFVFTVIASWALIGLWIVLFNPNLDRGAGFLAGGMLWVAFTEFQRGHLKRADAGAEAATALIAGVLAVASGAIGFGGSRVEDFLLRFLVAAFLVSSAAAWRWGDKLFFLGASLSGFGLLAQPGQGRLLWILASAILIPACVRAARDQRLSPSHRSGAVIVGVVAVLALYSAVHVWSWDQGVVEQLRLASSLAPAGPQGPFLRSLSILATAVLPPVLFLAGWRRREPLLLYGGLLLIGASIATIRLYREVMPLSLALILIGAACLTLALSVRRWLRSGMGGERHGFTADPLFDNTNRTEVIRTVVAMASFTPAAQPAPARSSFDGGGGGFGGGGASGTY